MFLDSHITGATFFDIDECLDKTTTLPHMLPSAADFAKYVGDMGIDEKDAVIIYDTKGIFSSPRVWYTFRYFGANNVAILEGGLPAWIKVGGTTEAGPAQKKEAKTFNTQVQT